MEPKRTVEDSLVEKLLFSDEKLLRECRIDRYQASGKGGQKRNRVLSAVRLTLAGGELVATSSEWREGGRNLKEALHRLRIQMALRVAERGDPSLFPEEWPPFRPQVSSGHEEFPFHVAKALTLFLFHQGRLAESAEGLETTSSALVRFFRKENHLWMRVQKERETRGMVPLL